MHMWCMHMCVCACARARTCLLACACVRARACVGVRVWRLNMVSSLYTLYSILVVLPHYPV